MLRWHSPDSALEWFGGKKRGQAEFPFPEQNAKTPFLRYRTGKTALELCAYLNRAYTMRPYSGGGKSGWRMPTLDELQQLYNSGVYGSVINRSGNFVWASETRGSDAAYFGFYYANRYWYPQSGTAYSRALPVHSGK